MQINIGAFEFSEVWNSVFYKKLSDYPRISDWEMRTLIEFMEYEKSHGRACEISCEDRSLRNTIEEKLKNNTAYLSAVRPKLITECTACPDRKGCETEFICHTTSVENAIKIFQCGKLLSAIKARAVPVEQLVKESRNAANDPPDYFEYIMFTWGNCQAGDRLVMERRLGRFPDDEDLSIHFKPGIRFYFKYDELKQHPNRVFDGVLPMKVKDEIILADWIYKIIIPLAEKNAVESQIPAALKDTVVYVENDCKDIWEWSEKVYQILEKG